MEKNFENSAYMASNVDRRIELTRRAYDIADENRSYAGTNNFGQIGTQFCGMIGEFIGELTSDGYDETSLLAISEDLYVAAWEHYPEYAMLLDGEDLR